MDDGQLPSSRAVWKEFGKAMRGVSGHNNRHSAEKFWAPVGADTWPKEPTFVGEEYRWPKHQELVGAPQETTNSGNLTPVSGLKYSMLGGFMNGQKYFGKGLTSVLAKVLVEAANHSLATSTWKSYASVWNRLSSISKETGVRFRYPMDTTMVQTLVAALIKRGRKAGTILSYMSAIRQAHLLRGLTAPALSDSMV